MEVHRERIFRSDIIGYSDYPEKLNYHHELGRPLETQVDEHRAIQGTGVIKGKSPREKSERL